MALMMGGDPGVLAFPEGDNIFNWVGTIVGSSSTTYKGTPYCLALAFTTEYPYKPPKVRFDTPCFHPNMDAHVCFDHYAFIPFYLLAFIFFKHICVQVLFTRGDAPIPISELSGLVCGDISNLQENFPIPATNLVDNPPVPPSGFVYSKTLQIPEDIKIPIDRIGCDCSVDCSTSKHCLCAERNGSDLPYVSTQRKSAKRNGSKHNSVGRLVEPKAFVYECGANCACHCNCVSRTSQQGLKYRLEVSKTESKGWGVRTWDTVLPGALICEYTGILRTTEVEGLLENNYIFDIDCLQTIKGLDGREQRASSERHMLSLHSEAISNGFLHISPHIRTF
ncbi:Histone-lysine N-methyltransferase, H3 lysine-9 specific SUVH4 [Dichanthelium oligosanthes]|uniref:Histone-lysine N-methyltransferase, H3 lysine-9 specific SUVH4 n=1 Tax=Dichanthelium oligosanthes TaxID=888268 RepID=A0A1E5WDC5_9POAL|nr:Histone-lysine N-methyltransferase, H3 lysine-9 specific SUVH4 [Dichanthelium oligosanthes]